MKLRVKNFWRHLNSNISKSSCKIISPILHKVQKWDFVTSSIGTKQSESTINNLIICEWQKLILIDPGFVIFFFFLNHSLLPFLPTNPYDEEGSDLLTIFEFQRLQGIQIDRYTWKYIHDIIWVKVAPICSIRSQCSTKKFLWHQMMLIQSF